MKAPPRIRPSLADVPGHRTAAEPGWTRWTRQTRRADIDGVPIQTRSQTVWCCTRSVACRAPRVERKCY